VHRTTSPLLPTTRKLVDIFDSPLRPSIMSPGPVLVVVKGRGKGGEKGKEGKKIMRRTRVDHVGSGFRPLSSARTVEVTKVGLAERDLRKGRGGERGHGSVFAASSCHEPKTSAPWRGRAPPCDGRRIRGGEGGRKRKLHFRDYTLRRARVLKLNP